MELFATEFMQGRIQHGFLGDVLLVPATVGARARKLLTDRIPGGNQSLGVGEGLKVIGNLPKLIRGGLR